VFTIIAIIALFLSVCYAGLILYFNAGWTQLNTYKTELSVAEPNVLFSIIIPARNEEGNIKNCLADILAQDYPASQYEVIVIDDFSEDNTAEKVEEFIKKHSGFNIRLIKLSDEGVAEQNSFKKLSITTGISYSRFSWIITSDADCRRGNLWLRTIASFILENDPVLISAPVCFAAPIGFFYKVQSIEFLGLIAIGAASIYQHTPNMCNGANLIYRKNAFYKVGGFKGYDDIASGDDEFLMHKINKEWPGRIFFLKNKDAIAYTNPAENLGAFIQQRKRWVSKSRKYARKSITAILSGAYIYHLCLLVCLVEGIFNLHYLALFSLAFGIKVLAEYIFLKNVSAFFHRERIMQMLLPAAFLYIFYVLIIGIYGNFGTYKWKGRQVK
jgi:cellulose synthase/poly-beta-1,6-N-acetylglucosamine synthase-like glycosyltransferase